MKFFSQKHFLPLILGFLILSISLPGVYSLFTSSEALSPGTLNTAEVSIKCIDSQSSVLNFWSAHPFNLEAQNELKSWVENCSWYDFKDGSAAFKFWWEKYHEAWIMTGDYILDSEEISPNAKDSKIYYSRSPKASTYNGKKMLKAPPGSVIIYTYQFVSGSSVPMYFRIAKPELLALTSDLKRDSSADLPMICMARYNLGEHANTYTFLEEGADGFLYYPFPLEPYNNSLRRENQVIEIAFAVYLTDEVCENDLREAIVSFNGDLESFDAEVIQATNNAVYLTDWLKSGVDFVPYEN